MLSRRSRPMAPGLRPFPVRQMFILALCRICEPIAFMSIFPYIYYMVLSFNITDNQQLIAIYAGMVTSAFTIAEFSTGVLWGRLSDRIGRKPVLLFGLAGTGLSMLVFGFARSLPVAIFARALGGLLNGNIGVLQTTVAEIITVREHQPRAYAIMPFIWCLGSIIGPALGGTLADPCTSYPGIFRRGTVFDRFPYLLPNLICTVIVICGVTIGILFLEETHEVRKHRRDVGLETGKWLCDMFRVATWHEAQAFSKEGEANLQEVEVLLEAEEPPPGYRSTEGSPAPPRRRLPAKVSCRVGKAASVEKAFSKQVVLNIIGYGILAYHTMTFEQLMPVMLSTPKSHTPPSLPLKFVGGFGLHTKDIGVIMSFQGVYSMVAQIFLFPMAVRCFGSLTVFRAVAIAFPLLYVLVPYLVLLPDRWRMVGLALCLIMKITGHVLAFPSNAILLANSAPSTLVLGTINGVAASTASLSRALGPTLSGLIHSAGLRWGYSGLAWWSSALVCVVGALESLWMEEVNARLGQHVPLDEEDGPDGADEEGSNEDGGGNGRVNCDGPSASGTPVVRPAAGLCHSLPAVNATTLPAPTCSLADTR